MTRLVLDGTTDSNTIDIPIIKWPPNCPDLTPIEHLKVRNCIPAPAIYNQLVDTVILRNRRIFPINKF